MDDWFDKFDKFVFGIGRNEKCIWRRKAIYDHSEGVLHLENLLGFISMILTMSGLAVAFVYYGDPLIFIVFGALTGLAGFIVSIAVIAEAGSYRNFKRILTASIGFIMSLAMLAMNVLMFIVLVLHYVP